MSRSFSSSPRINEDKYANALLFFVNECNNQWLGSTKLNKLMYYLDFISYRDKNISVTGDTYNHLDKGPVPESIEGIIRYLKNQDKLLIEEVPYQDGKKVKFTALSKPDLSVFDSYEKSLLEIIASTFKPWSTSRIVDQTHFESPWLYSKPYDMVDYAYAEDIDIIPTIAG